MLLLGGAAAWGVLSFRAMNQWVFHVTKGIWLRNLADIPSREVAIVPGTGFHNGRPNPNMEERLDLALTLFEAGRVQSILVSGNENAPGHEVSEMRNWLIARGVPAGRVVADPLGVRTLATMTRAVGVFGIRGAIICTQSWAAPRAVFLARGAGLDAVAFVPTVVSRRANDLFNAENLKVTLAFLEHYVLGRTRVVAPPAPALAMKVLSP